MSTFIKNNKENLYAKDTAEKIKTDLTNCH